MADAYLDSKVESWAHVSEDDRTLLNVGRLEIRDSHHLNTRSCVRFFRFNSALTYQFLFKKCVIYDCFRRFLVSFHVYFNDAMCIVHDNIAIGCKGGQANFFCLSANRRSANSWVHSVIANPQIFCGVPVHKPQIRKFVRNNPQIANPQILLVTQSANRKSTNLQGKK